MYNDIDVAEQITIEKSELSSVVSKQFANIAELEKQVTNSVNLAANAKQKAENAQISAGLFKKKEAIQLLQSAAEEQSNALISLADAQRLSLDYQKKLTDITQYLFALGVNNIAMNRSVYQQIKLSLEGASAEEISDLAKQELRRVLLQLKQQQDVLEQQEKLAGKVNAHTHALRTIEDSIEEKEQTDVRQDEKIVSISKALLAQEKNLSQQQRKDDEHDRKISEHTEKLSKYESVLVSHERKNRELEKHFAEHSNEEQKQTQKIAENATAIRNLEVLFSQSQSRQDEKNKALDENVANLSHAISCEISEWKRCASENNAALQRAIQDVSAETNKLYSDVTSKLEQTTYEMCCKIDNTSKSARSSELALSEHFEESFTEVNAIITSLTEQLNSINRTMLKRITAVSIIAFLSLVLNILQIFGVI